MNWWPGWTVEQRLPSFFMGGPGEWISHDWLALSMGMSLWGITSAMDMINLPNNENDPKKDFFLAFIASGDLRHIARTLNCLPSNYSGNLKILLNDCNMPIVCRNIVILLILGSIVDKTTATDIALHFQYSVFMPAEYCVTISSIITFLLKRAYDQGFGSIVIPLGQNSLLTFTLTKAMCIFFEHYISTSFLAQEIQDQYSKVRNAPSHGDYRNKMYAALRPSHHVAFLKFRQFGLVLPCGAPNAHFNTPNLSLFSLKGDVGDVVNVGKAHGANAEDIYGCLYFFLSKQLREVIDRLQTTSTSFFVQMLDACDLGCQIRDGSLAADGIPSSIRFDHIKVSNIIDANYVGLNNILTSWSPLLCVNHTTAIVGYFMNWFTIQCNGRVFGALEGGSVSSKLMRSLMDRVKQVRFHCCGSHNLIFTLLQGHGVELLEFEYVQTEFVAGYDLLCLGEMETKLYILPDVSDTIYDNSKPFSEFLKKQGINDILKKTDLTSVLCRLRNCCESRRLSLTATKHNCDLWSARGVLLYYVM
ncbi:uncharacterized protein LACBIDRAFT_299776 [Laccaria bicolor S238N-H82]|uniref:Predicted protein n=1 Tax=Laccaria bicolor (strain S238N-H82 / ATCC MYA-4686) TaxID=486041 RepID=B0DFE6_LACBS|nr:uncharacterized protein LACBIDRAFT_299776 [Laccaria bicolor S238N-H82]EDR06851.1 predicted protein [Laccaria bicolor S238N-H82]|eukprot:XP_001882698.1 predicted protein [Laccaria bicolor S238N-H82]